MKEIEELQEELKKKQLNQHFIFNTLNTIKCNAIIDTRNACRLIDDFSKYLRYNFNVLEQQEAISFREEIEQARVYLEIEMARFAQIQSEYFLEEENFFLPPMTIQPLVEDAVNYGLCRKDKGGTLSIKSFRKEEDYVIEIHDTGVGMETVFLEEAHVKEDYERLQTIEGVRRCLKHFVSGSVEVETVPEEGTQITIRIPAKQARNRDY